ILARMAGLGAARDGRLAPPIAELLLDRMAEEAGLEVLLYATPIALEWGEDKSVRGLQVATKSGDKGIAADFVIDATDSRILARSASLPLQVRDPVAGRSTIVLNLVEGDLGDGLTLGQAGQAVNVTVRPSVWPGEALVSYELPTLSPIE